MAFLQTDFSAGAQASTDAQKAKLAYQYAPAEAKRADEASQLELDVAKRKESDITGFAKEAADIMGKNILPTPKEEPKDTRGGYEPPDITKLNDILAANKVSMQTQAENKAKLSALMQSSLVHHNPAMAESYRKQIEEVDDKAKADQLSTLTTQATKDETFSRYASQMKADPESWNSNVLEMASLKIIPSDVAMKMLNATAEQKTQMIAGALAKGDSSKIKAQLAIATQRAEAIKDRTASMETREKERVLFKNKEFQLKKDNVEWIKKEKITSNNRADAKLHYSTLKDEVGFAEKEHDKNMSFYTGLLSERDKLQSKLDLYADDATVKNELTDLQNKIDKAEVWVNDSASDVSTAHQAEKEFAKKLGEPSVSPKEAPLTADKVEAKAKAKAKGKTSLDIPAESDRTLAKTTKDLHDRFVAHFGQEP